MAPTGGSSPRIRDLREALNSAADGERSLLTRAASTATQRARRHKRAKPLTLLPLVALCFYDVSGGPFGIEDAVSAGGPLLALIGFLCLPLLWSIPEALVTAELATAFPEDSGYVAWVTAAFGPYWGFQEGFWSWLSGVTDNSLYPVMFMSYLDVLVPVLKGSWERTVLLFAVSLALSYLNYRGLSVIGGTAVASTAYIIVPFVVMAALAAPHIEPRNWLVQDWGTVQWGSFINVMFWNLNYWDSVSTLAGEVAHPRRTFPRALCIAVMLVVVMYVGPLLVGLGVTTQASDWELGYFTRVAQIVGGGWLGWWMVSAAAISQIGQFEAEMCSDSFQLLGMAERGFLPAILARRSRHGTPTLAIILSSVGVLGLVSFDFLQIVELLNIIYCLAQLVEFFAFLHLRVKLPHLPRPYQVPLPTWALAVMLAPAIGLLVGIIALPFITMRWKVVCWTVGAIVVGAVLHPLMQLARRKEWMTFVETSPEKFAASLVGYEAAATEEEEVAVNGAAVPGSVDRHRMARMHSSMELPEEVPPEDYKDNDGGPASPWYASSTASSRDSLQSIPEAEEIDVESRRRVSTNL
mmetsp:Transcript_4868/g.13997  ORF Transcript_4868/g.13997 Transcript_4868/m.13997 type:complete len:580 (+) Transcript_4868:264-2003(+)|eukprot:CAMPEP_0206145032 /NCGR_PEP_ID=MMETSP1473-20131121/26167_1 /ASSEMBLY_ACC=CAM_ASM_001109 /TAXON_ID=1461547 /ORGANISM="Stichococcus sp, Strain RCC1054" /LENGTH=579 /DNA_ID=CAMNT_0053541085 /DNA_START=227 /DNA_END=1966 /DNA_ORIENTATION=+